MRNSNPVENTGVVVRRSDNAFLGSCFVFRYPETVLTAHHVVRDFASDDLGVAFPRSRAGGKLFQTVTVHAHPNADLAVLEINPPDEREITWANHQLFDDLGYGLDVMTFGYPDLSNSNTDIPVPRAFKGYVQRHFEHRSHMGYKYGAIELNFGCPGGLSGSHVFNHQHIGRTYGVIAENIKVGTELDSILEVDDDGKEFRESVQSIINYGVAVWLPGCSDWLDQIVPPVPPEEIHRRSKNQQLWS